MLTLDRVAFLQLNFITLKTTEMMAEWIGAVLANAERFQLAERERLTLENGIFSGRYYKQHCQYVKDLAGRIGFDVCLVRLKFSSMIDERRSEAIRLLKSAVSRCFRQHDLLFDMCDNGEEFSLVLTNVSLPGCSAVEQKLEKKILQLKIEQQIDFDLESRCEWLYQHDPTSSK